MIHQVSIFAMIAVAAMSAAAGAVAGAYFLLVKLLPKGLR